MCLIGGYLFFFCLPFFKDFYHVQLLRLFPFLFQFLVWGKWSWMLPMFYWCCFSLHRPKWKIEWYKDKTPGDEMSHYIFRSSRSRIHFWKCAYYCCSLSFILPTSTHWSWKLLSMYLDLFNEEFHRKSSDPLYTCKCLWLYCQSGSCCLLSLPRPWIQNVTVLWWNGHVGKGLELGEKWQRQYGMRLRHKNSFAVLQWKPQSQLKPHFKSLLLSIVLHIKCFLRNCHLMQLYKIMKEHKNPKVLSEGILWMVSAVEDFGVSHLKLKVVIAYV